jgi:hypothetical protein
VYGMIQRLAHCVSPPTMGGRGAAVAQRVPPLRGAFQLQAVNPMQSVHPDS